MGVQSHRADHGAKLHLPHPCLAARGTRSLPPPKKRPRTRGGGTDPGTSEEGILAKILGFATMAKALPSDLSPCLRCSLGGTRIWHQAEKVTIA